MTKTVTWLQISDIHLRVRDAYNQEVVLDTLLADLRERIAADGLSFDFIFLTGDIAYSGAPEEYRVAEDFVRKLAAATKVGLDAIFCVPGNHDVARARIVQPIVDLSTRDDVSRLLGDADILKQFRQRHIYYKDFIQRTFPWAANLSDSSLGYSINRQVNGIPVSIIGLNSSWVSGSGDDHGKLIIGERQVRDALKGVDDPAVLIALMHHPLSYLAEFDAVDVQALLNTRCDFVLHGHIHDFGVVGLNSPDSQVFYLAAGATYQGRREILSYNYVRLNLTSGNADVFARRYSDRQGGFWGSDNLMYRAAPQGILTFPLPERLTKQARSPGLGAVRELAEALSPQFSAGETALAATPQADVPPPGSVPNPPSRLVEEIIAGRCVLFAGSGASTDAQLPTWRELIRDLIDLGEAGGQIDSTDRRELDDLVARGVYLPAAEFCRDRIGGFDFTQYLHRKLSSHARYSQTHRLLSEIPFRAALTTNYDSFIEYSRGRTRVILPDTMEKYGALSLQEIFADGTFPVIKISGSLDDVDSIVLTQADFRKLSFSRPNYISLIRKILTDYTVFFYGSGFVDPNVNFLLEEIITRSGNKARPHYAVMPDQGPIMRDFRLKNYNIRVISYPLWRQSHVVAKAFLERLVAACRR